MRPRISTRVYVGRLVRQLVGWSVIISLKSTKLDENKPKSMDIKENQRLHHSSKIAASSICMSNELVYIMFFSLGVLYC